MRQGCILVANPPKLLITDSAIRDRFVQCLNEANSINTLEEIAEKCGTSASYLSQCKKNSRKIPPSIIANFCMTYFYSASWILTGKGTKRTKEDKSIEEKLIEQNKILIETLQEMSRKKGLDNLKNRKKRL